MKLHENTLCNVVRKLVETTVILIPNDWNVQFDGLLWPCHAKLEEL